MLPSRPIGSAEGNTSLRIRGHCGALETPLVPDAIPGSNATRLRAQFGLEAYITPAHFWDVGKIAFGFSIFWVYQFWSQYLPIWYANLPEEIGWVFLRFGILATLVWHYTVDAVLIGMFLLRSEHLTYRMAGAVVADAVLLPLVMAGVFYLQSRGFLRDERILNGAPE